MIIIRTCRTCGDHVVPHTRAYKLAPGKYICYMCAWELYQFDPSIMEMDKRWKKVGLVIEYEHSGRLALSPNGKLLFYS